MTSLSKCHWGYTLKLPVIHVDSIQDQSQWRRTADEQCDRILRDAAKQAQWIIDGFGNDDVIASRIEQADSVVFIDYPIWRHYCWALKRQLSSRKGQRRELPPNCPEFSSAYTKKLLLMMWLVHKEYTPWLRELIETKQRTGKVVVLRCPRESPRFVQGIPGESTIRPDK